MALHYEWAFDVSVIGSLTITFTDDGGTQSASISSGTYCATDISSVVSGYSDFATALESAMNTASSSGTYTVSWSYTTGYTIAYDGALFSIDLTGTDAQTRMARVLGFSGDRSGATSYASQVRPYYTLIPTMQGRSEMSDEYEPEGIVFEAVSDDGTRTQTAVDTAEILSDWMQVAETDQAPASFGASGTFPFKRQATSAVPWTYQHAWEHARTGHHPFLCVDGSESSVHLLRAEGGSFRPQRFASRDIALWTIPFRTALLGRI